MILEKYDEAYILSLNDKIMTSAKTCGAKIQGHYI